MAAIPATMKAVVNKRQGDSLVYGLAEVPTPTVSGDKDLIVKIEAAPINPSDMGSVGMVARFGGGKAVAGEAPSTVACPLPEAAAKMFQADGDVRPTGNEGVGIVVAAGAAAEAQALIGKRVAVSTGGTYAQYTKTTCDAEMFAQLPDDVSAMEGASVFVNPMTVVGFVHTMKEEGHKAIVHTAAASQLGRMLVRLCKEEGIPLVNIVRKDEGVETLKAMGAEFVVNSSAPTFKDDLLAAVNATGATLAFDATGGGTLAGDILTAFEQSLRFLHPDKVHPAYGPAGKRAVYKYGGLDKNNSEFPPSVGVGNWTWGGWLMPFHYAKFPPEHRQAGIAKVVAGLKTIFPTTYGTRLSLEDMAKSPEEYMATTQSQTDKKFLVQPNAEESVEGARGSVEEAAKKFLEQAIAAALTAPEENEARRVSVALALDEMQAALGQFEAPVVDWEIEIRGAWVLAPFKLPKNVTTGKKCHFTFVGVKCEIEFTSETGAVVRAKGKEYPSRLKQQ